MSRRGLNGSMRAAYPQYSTCTAVSWGTVLGCGSFAGLSDGDYGYVTENPPYERKVFVPKSYACDGCGAGIMSGTKKCDYCGRVVIWS